MITAAAAAQATVTAVNRRLQWKKWSINEAARTTATRRSRSCAKQGQRRTVELWPRRSACNGGAASREEEGDAQRVLSEGKRPELVGWVRKD